MTEAPQPRDTSNIYDLRYRRYDAERLGRRHAIFALYTESVRGAFGLGRSAAAKVAPMALIAVAVIPALISLVVATLTGEQLIAARDYYGVITYVLALYCASVAPDVAGRDQRSRALTLYFSRAISRTDYALSKFAAMTTAMLMVTLVPQLILFAGNALTAADLGAYASDEWGQLFSILGSALLGSALIASLGVLIAAHTPHRAFATVGIIMAFILPVVIVGIVVIGIAAPGTRYAVFASPLDVLEGLTAWLFGERNPDVVSEKVGTAGFDLWIYMPVAIAATLTATLLLVRRYRTVQA